MRRDKSVWYGSDGFGLARRCGTGGCGSVRSDSSVRAGAVRTDRGKVGESVGADGGGLAWYVGAVCLATLMWRLAGLTSVLRRGGRGLLWLLH